VRSRRSSLIFVFERALASGCRFARVQRPTPILASGRLNGDRGELKLLPALFGVGAKIEVLTVATSSDPSKNKRGIYKIHVQRVLLLQVIPLPQVLYDLFAEGSRLTPLLPP
jgi:hypothetical protein